MLCKFNIKFKKDNWMHRAALRPKNGLGILALSRAPDEVMAFEQIVKMLAGIRIYARIRMSGC